MRLRTACGTSFFAFLLQFQGSFGGGGPLFGVRRTFPASSRRWKTGQSHAVRGGSEAFFDGDAPAAKFAGNGFANEFAPALPAEFRVARPVHGRGQFDVHGESDEDLIFGPL